MTNLLFLIKIKMTALGISETDLAELIFPQVGNSLVWSRLERVSKRFNLVSKRKLIKKEEIINNYKSIWTELPNNRKHGIYRMLFPNGKICFECNYLNDVIHGVFRRWYANKQIHYEFNYLYGKLHGTCKTWLLNNCLVNNHEWGDERGRNLCKPLPPAEYSYCLTNYLNDVKHERKGYYSNEQLMYHYYISNDKRNGEYKWWDHTGKLVINEYYVDDKLVT